MFNQSRYVQSTVLIYRKAKKADKPENPYEEHTNGTVNKAYESDSEQTGF